MVRFMGAGNYLFEAPKPAADSAEKGGIDFNTGRMDLQVQSNGGAINFNFDSAMTG